MSQETPLNKLNGGGMNDEDSRLVDSILNDLNDTNQGGQPPMRQQQMGQQQMGQQQMGQQQMGQQQMGQPPLTEEQHRMMLAQRQQVMMQQQAMMQQAMMQGEMHKTEKESILDKLQNEWKTLLLVVVLSIVMNMGFVDGLFRSNENTYFVLEDGSLNIQATILKAFIIGAIFFFAKNAM